MRSYTSDNFIVFSALMNDGELIYKLLVGTSGGYAHGSSWRISSPIVKCEDFEDPLTNQKMLKFTTESGGEYLSGEDSECLRMNNAWVWNKLVTEFGDRVKRVEIDTRWVDFDFSSEYITKAII